MPPERAPAAGRRWRAGERPWRSLVFAPVGDGATRRRGSDALRLGVACFGVLVCWFLVATGGHGDLSVATFFSSAPSGIHWLVSTVWWLGTIGVVAALVLLTVLSRRWNVLRDLAVAGAGAYLIGVLLQLLWGPDGGRPSPPAHSLVNLGFPLARIAAVVAVAFAALPYLSRVLQRLIQVAVLAVAVATLVQAFGTPLSVAASVFIGWGTVALVHLIVGSPLGLPSAAEVTVLLSDLGVGVTDVRPSGHQVWGVARYHGVDDRGRLDASVYGRDAADAQLLGKVARFAFYRDSGPQLMLTRAQQVEHEAYLMLVAERSGARVPAVVVAGSAGPARDALLVTRPPRGRRLSDLLDPAAAQWAEQARARQALPSQERIEAEAAASAQRDADGSLGADVVGDECLRDLFHQVALLHAAGVAHGSIGPDSVVVTERTAGLVDFRCSSHGASAERLGRDTAAALATAGLVAGTERAVKAAVAEIPAEELTAALPFLQRAALGPGVQPALRGRKALLTSLREKGAAAIGVDVPDLVEPRRISWINLVTVVGSLVGGWALLLVLIDVAHSFDTIKGANWGWVVAVAILAQAAYPSEAVSVLGSVVDPIPYGRAVSLEFANSFVALAAGSMGVLATRVRFFQKQGYDATLAVSSGALVSTASWIVKGLLFVVALPIAISSFNLKQPSNGTANGGHASLVWLIVVFVVAIGVALGVVLLVPRLRRLATDKLRPKLSEVYAQLRVLARHPRNLVEVFGGCMAAQLLVVLALGAALHAFGEHLSIAQLVMAITLASMLGGVSPVPGGMGVVEAGMILSLTAFGIPESVAVAATFVQRMFTSYLPPIWGWCFMIGMRRRDYL